MAPAPPSKSGSPYQRIVSVKAVSMHSAMTWCVVAHSAPMARMSKVSSRFRNSMDVGQKHVMQSKPLNRRGSSTWIFGR